MKVAVLTLGCKVNKYESDALIFQLRERGFEATDGLEKADAYIINTCAVTNEAESKSRQMIERARKLNDKAHIFVVGCASQNRPIQFDGKGVDFVLGSADKTRILQEIENLRICQSQASEREEASFSLPEEYEDNLFSVQSKTRAFIKVQDGCNHFCTYCIIPYIRGRSRSRAVESVVHEVEKLPENVKEIVLVGIDLSDYKVDGKKALGELLTKLDGFGKRIRLSSLEDNLIEEDFLETLSSLKNFCPHFHLSLQSGSDAVLKKMNRNYTTSRFEESVNLIRKHFPLAGITTDIIVGFPTETEEDFEETLRFVERVKFSQIHVFPYSKRDGTAAAKLYKDLPKKVKTDRAERLIKLGERLKKEFVLQNKTGEVLVEEIKDGKAEGYTKNYIKCAFPATAKVGEIVRVQIKSYSNSLATCEILKK